MDRSQWDTPIRSKFLISFYNVNTIEVIVSTNNGALPSTVKIAPTVVITYDALITTKNSVSRASRGQNIKIHPDSNLTITFKSAERKNFFRNLAEKNCERKSFWETKLFIYKLTNLQGKDILRFFFQKNLIWFTENMSIMECIYNFENWKSSKKKEYSVGWQG